METDTYITLLSHINDLKKVCEKLKLDLNLLEIPIQQANSRVLPLIFAMDDEPSSDSSSSESSISSDDSDI